MFRSAVQEASYVHTVIHKLEVFCAVEHSIEL